MRCDVMWTISAIPWWQWCHGLEAVGVADHLVQGTDNLAEFGPVVTVFLPAIQHQLMQCTWAIHRGRQSVVLLYGIDYLQYNIRNQTTDKLQKMWIIYVSWILRYRWIKKFTEYIPAKKTNKNLLWILTADLNLKAFLTLLFSSWVSLRA